MINILPGNFFYYAQQVNHLYESRLEQAAAAYELSMPEAVVLAFLYENPEYDTARDVAIYRYVSKGYVSKAVDLLVQKGFVSIKPDETDRRLRRLALTKAAVQAAQALITAQAAFVDTLTAKLTPEEMQGLVLALVKCAESATEALQEG